MRSPFLRRRAVLAVLALAHAAAFLGVAQSLLSRRRLALRSGWVMKADDR